MSESAVPPKLPQEQKLLSIYLDNTAYAKGKMIVGSFADKHGLIESHLEAYLEEGWRVKQISMAGGATDSLAVRCWVVVLLERG